MRLRSRPPPEAIWNIIVAIDRWPDWNPDVRATFIESDLAVGTRFSWKAGQWTIRSTVLQMERPHRLLWTGTTTGIKAVGSLADREERRKGAHQVGGVLGRSSAKHLRQAFASFIWSGVRLAEKLKSLVSMPFRCLEPIPARPG